MALQLHLVGPRCGRLAARRILGQSRRPARRRGGVGMPIRCMSVVEGLSIRRGPDEPALLSSTIPENFASVVSRHGDRPAVVCRAPIPAASTASAPETTLTYDAIDALSNRLASSLAQMGVVKGQRVAVSLGNTPEFAALTYALFKLGAVLVPLNPSFTAHQVTSALAHLAADVLVIAAVTDLAYRPGAGRSNEHLLRAVVGGDLSSPRIQSEAVPSLRHVVVVDNRASHPDVSVPVESYPCLTPYSDLLQGSPRPVRPSAPLLPDDTVNIQFTSGTTSLPKAAMLTHSSILNNGRFIAHRMGLVPSDRIVVPPPLFHCFGSVLGYMATATTGCSLLFPSPAFDPVAAMRMCSDHDATGLYGVSTMFVAFLEALDAAEAGSGPGPRLPPPLSLRKGIIAGSSVPEAIMAKIQSRIGLDDLVICYGMTETSPVSCMTSPSDHPRYRASTVGTVMPHTTLKIVSPADRSVILPLGERGELAASGYLAMQGYYGDPERTAEVLVDEPNPLLPSSPTTKWVYSGDEASMDHDGYVRITGRIKDLIIRGGENIHPLEIENCLFRMPGVQEVSVAGVPDERLGEAVAAFIIRRHGHEHDGAAQLTEAAVRDWVRSHLSSHLVPKHVFWVDEYPTTASGKIQKFKLRDMAVEKLRG